MKFNTHFNRDISSEPFSPSGDKVEEDYILESTPFGDKLVSSGKKLTYAKIQAACDAPTVSSVIERCEAGDNSHLIDPKSAQYLDLVGMPKDPIEMFQVISKADAAFDGLPASVKQYYKGSRVAFTDDLLSGRFSERFTLDGDKLVVKVPAASPVAASPAAVSPAAASQAAVSPAAVSPAAASPAQTVTINGITYTQQEITI